MKITILYSCTIFLHNIVNDINFFFFFSFFVQNVNFSFLKSVKKYEIFLFDMCVMLCHFPRDERSSFTIFATEKSFPTFFWGGVGRPTETSGHFLLTEFQELSFGTNWKTFGAVVFEISQNNDLYALYGWAVAIFGGKGRSYINKWSIVVNRI